MENLNLALIGFVLLNSLIFYYQILLSYQFVGGQVLQLNFILLKHVGLATIGAVLVYAALSLFGFGAGFGLAVMLLVVVAFRLFGLIK